MAEATMREVVQRLRAENCRALLELREFQYALDDVLKNVEQFAAASDDICRAAQDSGGPLNERTDQLSTHATQIVLAFRAVRVAVLGWNIAGAFGLRRDPAAMYAVVERLRVDGKALTVELRAFDASFDPLLQSLALLALAAGELHAAAQNAGPRGSIQGFRMMRAMRARADQLRGRSQEALSAFRTLCDVVARWNIMGTNEGSSRSQ